MTRLAGEFQTDVPLDDALAACSEAIDSLGWRIESVGASRIVSRAANGGEVAPTIEVVLDQSDSATDIQIVGTDAEAHPLSQEELISELSSVRDAIEESLEHVDYAPSEAVGGPPAAEQPPPVEPPAGWYPDSTAGGRLRYWDGRSWTNQFQDAPAPDPHGTSPARRGARPRWRKMTWVLIIWSALILIWAITGAAANECGSEPTQLEQDACEAGTGIGVALILLIGFFGFAFFSLIWFMTRPKGRECPACGERVKPGQTRCPECGHDFAAAAGQRQPAMG